MITIMKTYNSPMLQVVSISQKDIIATSLGLHNDVFKNTNEAEAAGRFRDFDEWYEGY